MSTYHLQFWRFCFVTSPFYLIFILIILSFVSPVYAQKGSLDQQAAELAQLRADVEQLHLDLEQMRQDTQAKIRALASQKAGLSAEVQRARIRVEQLNIEKSKKQEVIRRASAQQTALKPPLINWVKQLELWTQDHLPYRQEGRLKEIQKLKKQLESDLILPSRALTQVWSWVEDEIKLSRESTLDRTIITLEGKDVLVDLVRIGMVMMLCRTPQGQYGISYSQSPKQWDWTLFEPDSFEFNAARNLFERFEQKIHLGFFWLPSRLQFPQVSGTSSSSSSPTPVQKIHQAQ